MTLGIYAALNLYECIIAKSMQPLRLVFQKFHSDIRPIFVVQQRYIDLGLKCL